MPEQSIWNIYLARHQKIYSVVGQQILKKQLHLKEEHIKFIEESGNTWNNLESRGMHRVRLVVWPYAIAMLFISFHFSKCRKTIV